MDLSQFYVECKNNFHLLKFSFFLLLVFSQSSCESYPCKNGGDCVPDYELNSYVCNCKGEFYGKHCDHKGNILNNMAYMRWKIVRLCEVALNDKVKVLIR